LKNGKNTRKQKGTPPSQITRFFGSKIPYLKNYPIQLAFVDDLALYIAKGKAIVLCGKPLVEAHSYASNSQNCFSFSSLDC
jgi:hypothetical protein